MKLSIIVPVYNVEKYIDECIASLYDQGLDLDSFEILLIDDGSTDSSLAIAKGWASNYRNIRVYHQKNQGQAVARNLGIEQANGDYLMFVDSDDYLLPDKVSMLLHIVEEQNLDAIVYCFKEENKDGSTRFLEIHDVKYNIIHTGEEVVLKYDIFGSMCRGIFSRNIFVKENLQFSIGHTHEDSELCFRLYPCLHRILFIREAVYFYRYNEVSTDRSKDGSKLRRNIESDAIIAAKIKASVADSLYSKRICNRYTKIINSMMVAFFINVRRSHIWDSDKIATKIKWLEEISVYPIKGKTNSWRSFVLSKIFNIKNLLIYMLKD